MADRYLKHIPSGIIYIMQPAFAAREDFIEVADLAGAPMPGDGTPEPVVEKKPRAKRAKVEADPLADIDAALSADASRGLPK